MIAYDVQIKTKISEYGYDFGFNGQGQLFLEFVLQLTTQTPFIFMEDVQFSIMMTYSI